jgi:HAD superfamily hydrolase (TIGR01509 family)
VAFQALIFDAGGVFIPHDNAALSRRLAGRCADPVAVQAEIERLWWQECYATGERPVRHVHEQLISHFGYDAPWETFVEDWSSHLDVDLAMVELIERLAQANRVLIFSNTTAEHWERVDVLTAGRLAHLETYLSHEIGAVKPHVPAFRLVAESAGLAPARCLFIDDRADNVDGARQAGFQAEVFTDQFSLERLLRQAGVTWPQAAEMERS